MGSGRLYLGPFQSVCDVGGQERLAQLKGSVCPCAGSWRPPRGPGARLTHHQQPPGVQPPLLFLLFPAGVPVAIGCPAVSDRTAGLHTHL